MRTTSLSEEILNAFADRVRKRGDDPVVIGPERTVSARDLDRDAGDLAGLLSTAALPPGSIVALRCPNGPAFLSGLLAIRRADCVALLVDSGTPNDALDRIIRTLGVRAVLTSSHGWGIEFVVEECARSGAVLSPEIGYIKLTSGSSGAPRGILVSPAALAADARALARTMRFGPGDRFLATIPMSHSYGLSILAIPALISETVLIEPSGSHPLREARRHGARIFPTVPCLLQALFAHRGFEWPDSIELVITAGERTHPELAREFHRRTGRKVHVFYGSSESGGITFDRSGDAAEQGWVGTPIDGVRVELVKGDQPETIAVESPAVATDYHPDPEPRLGNGRFVTDDLGQWQGKQLVLTGRTGRWINIRGKKVDPLEVEGVIGELAGVNDVVVIRECVHEPKGEVLKAVIATDAELSHMEVTKWCRDRLASHKTPRRMVFVSELPRTERGKLDRAALEQLRPKSE